MARIINFANRKGGSGKTTSAVNIAHGLALRNKKVLLVDMDPQGHSSISLGIMEYDSDKNLYSALRGITPITDIIHNIRENLDIIPACKELSDFETSFKEEKLWIIKENIQAIENNYDFIIFDPPPTIGNLMLSSMIASNEVFVPMQADFLAMEGFAEMVQLIHKIGDLYNPNLKLKGVIFNFFDGRVKAYRKIAEDIKNSFNYELMFFEVRRNISIAEAPARHMSVLEYAPESNGSRDYRCIVNRILKMEG